MKVLICPDKFKDSLGAIEVAKAIHTGIKKADQNIHTVLFPLADGGEGTARILTYHTKGRTIETTVHDPLMRPVNASFGISKDGKTAYIEMAEASGIHLLNNDERNCFHTTTYGTGELILAALNKGVKKIVLGIGGSATSDAGIGMATALGYRFLDRSGNILEPAGKNLVHLSHIDRSHLKFNPDEIHFETACDVNNPLSGPDGAAHIYGPQKGATQEEIRILDKGLKNFALIVENSMGKEIDRVPGAGAAGGMGAASILFLGSLLVPGVELVMKETRFSGFIPDTDLVITGEGKIDQQSLSGKVIRGVTNEVKKYNIPVAALCGTLDNGPELTRKLEIDFAASILHAPENIKDALKRTKKDLQNMAYQVIKLFMAGQQKL